MLCLGFCVQGVKVLSIGVAEDVFLLLAWGLEDGPSDPKAFMQPSKMVPKGGQFSPSSPK